MFSTNEATLTVNHPEAFSTELFMHLFNMPIKCIRDAFFTSLPAEWNPGKHKFGLYWSENVVIGGIVANFYPRETTFLALLFIKCLLKPLFFWLPMCMLNDLISEHHSILTSGYWGNSPPRVQFPNSVKLQAPWNCWNASTTGSNISLAVHKFKDYRNWFVCFYKAPTLFWWATWEVV